MALPGHQAGAPLRLQWIADEYGVTAGPPRPSGRGSVAALHRTPTAPST